MDLDEARELLRGELQKLEDLGALQQEHEPDWVALDAQGQSLASDEARAVHGLHVAQLRHNYLTSQRLFATEQRGSVMMGLLVQFSERLPSFVSCHLA